MSMFKVNKWERKQLRKKIDKKKEIGAHFRAKKENKTCKWKLQKQRRSKRRNLMKSTIHSTFHYITENIHINTRIKWNNKPILSPHDYDIARNYVPMDLEILAPKNNLFCVFCNQDSGTKQLMTINCKRCKKFIALTIPNRLQYHICNKCSISADICTSKHHKSSFCSRRYRMSCNHRSNYFPIKRINKLSEPTQWEWIPHVYGYKVDEAVRGNVSYKCAKIVNNNFFKVFCTKDTCEGAKLNVCAYDGCLNKDIQNSNFCANHKCISCNHYPAMNPRSHVDTKPKKCIYCKHIYCTHDLYSSDCGSTKTNACNNCFLKNEKNALKHAIYDNVPFCDDIATIIYENSIGYSFECSNYENCDNILCIESSLYFDKNGAAYDIDGERFSYYEIYDENRIKKHTKYLTKIGAAYCRIFCHECYCGDVFKWCTECDNRDIGFISLEVDDYICLNHDFEIANNECGLCLNKEYTLSLVKAMKHCEQCDRNICCKCHENGFHKEYCKCFQLKQIDEEIKYYQDFGGFNENLMDYNFITNYNEWSIMKNRHNNNGKKSSRKRTKNKNKNKSYWKRQHDKKGNLKYKRKYNKHKLFNICM